MSQPLQDSKRFAIGIMTGTSIDGMDAALVRINGRGLSMRAEFMRSSSQPLGLLADRLRCAAEQQPLTAGDFAKLAWEFGELHGQVVMKLLQMAGMKPDDLSLVCVHGQTVFHQPPFSWQMLNSAVIAQRLGRPVISDLRQADLAAGGQGAPITPLADWILFRDAHHRRAIVNLGGFCNITILPCSKAADPLAAIRGFDVCPCNQILDSIARNVLLKPFDEHGQSAASGSVDMPAAQRLGDILKSLRASQRSLGTGDEAMAWVQSEAKRMKPNDLAASAVHAIAQCISESLAKHDVEELILAGGGAHHRALTREISHHAKVPTHLSDALGVPIEAREAIAFAILGTLCADGIPITLPQITGCRAPAPLAGAWCGLQCDAQNS